MASGFNATMETDFLLNASYGFVSSEGWFAEDLQQRLATRRAMVDHCGFVCALYVRNMKAQKNQVLGPGCMLYWSRTMGECTTIYDLWQWIWYLKQEHCSTVVYCLHIWLLPTAFPPLQCQTMRWYLKHTNGQVDLLHYFASIFPTAFPLEIASRSYSSWNYRVTQAVSTVNGAAAAPFFIVMHFACRISMD